LNFLFFVRCSHTSDGNLLRHNGLHGLRKRKLHWPPDLSTVNTRAHNRSKCTYVEEILAHEHPKLSCLIIVLWIELGFFVNFLIVWTQGLISTSMLLIKNRSLLHIDMKSVFERSSKLHIVPNLPL